MLAHTASCTSFRESAKAWCRYAAVMTTPVASRSASPGDPATQAVLLFIQRLPLAPPLSRSLAFTDDFRLVSLVEPDNGRKPRGEPRFQRNMVGARGQPDHAITGFHRFGQHPAPQPV